MIVQVEGVRAQVVLHACAPEPSTSMPAISPGDMRRCSTDSFNATDSPSTSRVSTTSVQDVAAAREEASANVREATEHELAEQTRLRRTEDFREGVKAMAERRTPRFTGR